jgi:thiol:disulfide interchange protein DsbD
MGFIALLLGIKFFSNADVTQGWHILGRERFVIITMLFAVMVGCHMLGFIRLSNDYQRPINNYNQNYVPIVWLLVAFLSFVLAIYLLPGLWGAPLDGVNFFLPPADA